MLSPMEMFLLCVGLGVALAIVFVLKFFVAKWCNCSLCAKESRPRAYILSTDPRLAPTGSTISQSASTSDPSRSRAGGNRYLEYTSLYPQRDNQQPHALIRSEPSLPGEAAMFLTFTFSDDQNNIHIDRPLEDKDFSELHDPPPRYEDLFPTSIHGLKVIEEESSV